MAYQHLLPNEITSRLNELRTQVRRQALIRGAGLSLCGIIGGLVALLLLDYLGDLSSATRGLLLPGWLAGSAALVFWLLIRPLARTIPDADLAALAERHVPELGERVSSLTELANENVPEAQKGSRLMRELLEAETLSLLRNCQLDEAVPMQAAVRRLWLGSAALAAFLVFGILFSSVSQLLLVRLFVPWGNYATASRLLIELSESDRVVARGTDVRVEARLRWRSGSEEPVPEPVVLRLTTGQGVRDERSLRFDADSGLFVAVIPGTQDSFEFHVEADGSRSESGRVQVEDPPAVLAATLQVTPPGYLGQPRQSHDGITGEIAVFERSTLQFHLLFNKPLQSAELEWMAPQVLPESQHAPRKPASSEPPEKIIGTTTNGLVAVDAIPATSLVLAPDRRSATLELPAEVQGTFAFRLKDQLGLVNADDPHREMLIARDQPPVLELTGGQQDEARPDDVYPVRVTVSDDLAVEELELVLTRRDGTQQSFMVPEKSGLKQVEHEFRVDLKDLAVLEGDVIRLQVRASDGRPVPGPNEVWSPLRTVAIRSNASAPGSLDRLAENKSIRDEMEALKRELAQARDAADELHERAAQADDAGRDLTALEKQQLQELAERETQVAERLQELAERLATRPLQQEVAQKIEQVARNNVAEPAGQLDAAVEQAAREQQDTLRENADAVDRAEEQLAGLQQRFEKLAELENQLAELDRIAQRAAQLADDVEQLEERRQELAAGPLEGEAPQQHAAAEQALNEDRRELAAEQRELVGSLEQLLEQQPQLLEAAREHQLQRLSELAEQARRLAEPQEALAEALRNEPARERQVAATTPEQRDAARSEATPPAGRAVPGNPTPPGNPTGEPGENDPAAADVPMRDPQNRDGEPATANPMAGQPGSPANTQQQPQAESAPAAPNEAANGNEIEPLLQRQEELARAAEQLAADAAPSAEMSERGSAAQGEAAQNNAATQTAQQAAEQSRQALNEARGGRFAEAAQQAAAAAESGQAAAGALEATPALAAEAENIAGEQAQLAAEFNALAEDEARRFAAREARQQALARDAAELAQAFEELAEALPSSPLGLQEPGTNAAEAKAASQQGQQAAEEAAQELASGQSAAAAESGRQAAEALRRAAEQAGQTASPPAGQNPGSDDNPIPGPTATQVAEAIRRLQQAGQQLAGEPGASGSEPPAGPSGSEQATAGTGAPMPAGARAAGEPEASATASAAGEPSGPPASGQAQAAASGQPAVSPESGAGEPAASAGNSSTAGSENASQAQAGQRSQGGQQGRPGSTPGRSTGNPNGGPPGAGSGSPSLAGAAESLQQVASMLQAAAQQMNGRAAASGQPASGSPSGVPQGLGNAGTGNFAAGPVGDLPDVVLNPQSQKDWGRLPGRLKTEILQATQRKPDGDYSKLIKLYFEELARGSRSAPAPDAPGR